MVRRLMIALAVLAGVLVFGTIGYAVVERWSLFDALYMTVLTVGTVGFHEVHALSPVGRAFTIVLILVGVGAVGFVFATIVDFVVEGHLTGLLKERQMERTLARLDRHHIVAGLGRVGSEVVAAFDAEHVPFVVIESSPEAAEQGRALGWLVLEGDATEEEILQSAGIERAVSLVTTLDSDAANVFVSLTARTMNPNLFIVARASSSAAEGKLTRAGADRVITPSVIGGRRMATMVLQPYVSQYVDLVDTRGEDMRLEEIELAETSPIVGRVLRDARITERTGVIVLAMRSKDGRVAATPSSDTMLQAGARLVVMGTVTQLENLTSWL